MNSSSQFFAVGVGLTLGLASLASGETTGGSSESALRSELQTLKARLSELEAKQSDTWLNDRRAEEVKGLIREVLSDADTRASLMASGAVAGHDGKSFFLASEDGSFVLNVGGHLQFRYIYNSTDRAPGADEDEGGFQFRRAKLSFKGHVGSPKIKYGVGIQTNRNTQNIDLDYAWVGYQWMDNVTVYAGQSKGPFLREEGTSSSKQLTVERSLVNELFTGGRIQGVWAKIEADDSTIFTVTINDGANNGEVGAVSDFQNDASDIAFGGRMDMKLAGEWSQMKDFSAWSGEQQAVFIGAAVHYEIAETGDSQASGVLAAGSPFNPGAAVGYDEFLAWTLDGSIESDGMNLYAAVMGAHFNVVGGGSDIDAYGMVIQGGYMIIPDKLEPFVRWELIDPDATHQVNLVTVGANYYIKKHAAKFTTDLVWALNSLSNVGGSSGLGLLTDAAAADDQFALRTQFQLLF